jgi:O-antigen ligase
MLLSFVLIYLLHAITGIAHYDAAGGTLGQDLVLQLPLLLLPLAFWLLPPWLEAQRNTLWLVLIGCCLLSAIGSTINYLVDYKEINQAYLHSKIMPTVPDYIRFSLLVSMAVLAGALLFFKRALPARWHWSTGGAVVLLYVFQHLLAVRSGLLTMYAGGVLLLAWLGWQRAYRKALLRTVATIVALAGLSLLLFPTLQNKILNTREDASVIKSTEAANNYSITARVYSYKVAWAIIREHPVFGVSKVKLNTEIAKRYGAMYPQIEKEHYLLPHNQFIYNLAAYGIVGLLVFVLGFYYPLGVALAQRNILAVLVYVVVSLSFLVEYTLETQIGVLTGSFFILLALVPTVPSPRSGAALPR